MRQCTMERAAVVSGCRTPSVPEYNISTSTLAFNQHFITTAKGILLLAEIVCGMLVWILVGGTHYFHLSALCWVMFVAILCWILTVSLFIIYLIGAHKRIPQVPWTTVSLCLNCSAAVLYLVTAVVDALTVTEAIRGRHNYNCWAASAFFAFLTTLCYAGSSYLSFCDWKTTEEQQ
ncbi:CKLF-like MARVEL transmembrane domain-containing protein 8 [Seriola dumerili]|uniref:CKLF-like MARVEL transmembrane domain containing 8b n=1 Tax=Seriola dumerili TaxID=41447 RepID=A0A3B4UE99_SERDU|nr:CKLF-like MARVEL transmembrane domain-containing protein 8 [Seriola dumerili]XP_056237688.1 CKLF-like MARVEL transmembrane domain-containing protein 8b [Seriola aureovittata]